MLYFCSSGPAFHLSQRQAHPVPPLVMRSPPPPPRTGGLFEITMLMSAWPDVRLGRRIWNVSTDAVISPLRARPVALRAPEPRVRLLRCYGKLRLWLAASLGIKQSWV